MRYFNFGKLQNRSPEEAGGWLSGVNLKSPNKEHSLSALRVIKEYCIAAWNDPSFGVAEQRDFSNSIENLGTQVSRDNGLTLVISCDSIYFLKYARYFIISHLLVDNESHIHLLLTFPTDEAIATAEELLASEAGRQLSISVFRADYFNNLLYPNVFFTSARFIMNSFLQRKSKTAIFNADVDGLVRHSYHGALIGELENYDVCAVMRGRKLRPSRRVLAGAFATSDTEGANRFNSALSRAIIRILLEGPTYHVDQTVIHYLIQCARRDKFKVKEMPESFVDFRFDEGSYIWSAKGKKGKMDPKFLAELSKCRESYSKIVLDGIKSQR
jgi:hypothetical protein